MESRRYPTDLSDDEWRCIIPHLPEPAGWGRPRLHGLRAILDAVFFYVLKSGCPWRLLPRDFPPWKSVYDWFRKWRIDGTWERLNTELRERLRVRLGRRDPNPSVGIVDSQSAKTTGVGGEQRGYDSAKKVRGRKRHLCWWIPKAWCSEPRYIAPRCTTRMASSCCWSPRGSNFRASSTCGWTLATGAGAGRRWAEEVLGLSIEVVRKPPKPVPEKVAKVWAEEWAKEGKKVDWQRLMPPRGFRVLPRR